jgi:hypothetical protein
MRSGATSPPSRVPKPTSRAASLAPTFEVQTRIVLRKSIVSPEGVERRPSSRIESSRSHTFGVRLLELVEEHDLEGLRTHGIDEASGGSLAIRIPHELHEAAVVLELREIEAEHPVGAAEEPLRERARRLRLAHARRTHEEEGAERPAGIVQARLEERDRLEEGLDRGGLSDDAFREPRAHLEVASGMSVETTRSGRPWISANARSTWMRSIGPGGRIEMRAPSSPARAEICGSPSSSRTRRAGPGCAREGRKRVGSATSAARAGGVSSSSRAPARSSRIESTASCESGATSTSSKRPTKSGWRRRCSRRSLLTSPTSLTSPRSTEPRIASNTTVSLCAVRPCSSRFQMSETTSVAPEASRRIVVTRVCHSPRYFVPRKRSLVEISPDAAFAARVHAARDLREHRALAGAGHADEQHRAPAIEQVEHPRDLALSKGDRRAIGRERDEIARVAGQRRLGHGRHGGRMIAPPARSFAPPRARSGRATRSRVEGSERTIPPRGPMTTPKVLFFLALSLLGGAWLGCSGGTTATTPTTPTTQGTSAQVDAVSLAAQHWHLTDATRADGTRIAELLPRADRPIQLDFTDGHVGGCRTRATTWRAASP